MLHIILIILKIIGIVLLTILGLLLLVTGIVLYVPFKYEAESSVKGTLDSVKANVKFSWLFHLVRGKLRYIDRKLEWQVWVFWKKFPNAVVDQKDLIEKTENAVDTMEEAAEDVIEESAAEVTEKSVEEIREETADKNLTDDKDSDKTASEEALETKKAKKRTRNYKKPKKEKFTDKIKSTFHSFCDKIKTICEKKEALETFVTDKVHVDAFGKVKNELFRFVKKLKPKKFHLKLHFGFEDPSITGKVLGLLCMLYPIFEDNIEMKPDFQNAVLEGNVFIKGKLYGSLPAGMILRLILDKNVRRTFIELMSGNKTKKRRVKQKRKSKV